MRIGIDAHALGTSAGGNETFIRELLEGLQLVAPEADILAYVHDAAHRMVDAAAGFRTYPLKINNSWARVPIELPWAAMRSKADMIHVQYIAPPVCPCPFVVTVHDIVWDVYPELMRDVDRARLRALVPWTVKRASRVVAVTEAMRQAIAERYNIDTKKIDLIQTSCDPLFQRVEDKDELDSCHRKYGIDGEYVLYIGALQPRKNIARLAEAFARLKAKGLPHKLVVVGKKTWLYDDIMKKIEDLNLGDDIIYTGYVDRVDLPRLITAAEVFAYVSVYEGYGLPVIEAMACGTPVLASTDPAISEVAGGAAHLCDPFDVDSIEHALEEVLSNEDLRADLRAKGPDRAATFSRERMGRAAVECYSKVVLGDVV